MKQAQAIFILGAVCIVQKSQATIQAAKGFFDSEGLRVRPHP
jgi:hypothetical protein